MKKHLLLLLLISISYFGFGQNIYPIKYDDCNTSQFSLEGKEISAEYDNELLLNDLTKTIDEKVLRKIKGSVYFQLVVDSMGNHCCVSMKNELNSKGEKIDFKKIIDNETTWGIPIRNGKKTIISVMIKIEFEKDRIIIKRLGFNTKTGLIELSKHEVKR